MKIIKSYASVTRVVHTSFSTQAMFTWAKKKADKPSRLPVQATSITISTSTKTSSSSHTHSTSPSLISSSSNSASSQDKIKKNTINLRFKTEVCLKGQERHTRTPSRSTIDVDILQSSPG